MTTAQVKQMRAFMISSQYRERKLSACKMRRISTAGKPDLIYYDSLLRFFLKLDGEVGLAGFGGVDEGGAFAAAFGGAEEQALLGAVG